MTKKKVVIERKWKAADWRAGYAGHAATLRVFDDRSTEYRPSWHAQAFPSVPKLLTPRARIETADKVISRLRKEWVPDKGEADYRKEACAKQIGRTFMSDWHLVATQGHCALLLPGAGDKGPGFSVALWGDYVVIKDPEFHLAVKRAGVCGAPADRVTLTYNGGKLRVSAGALGEHSDNGEIEFEQDVDVQAHIAHKFVVNISGAYLEQCCGVWPLVIHRGEEGTPYVIRPAGDQFRALVMPIKV